MSVLTAHIKDGVVVNITVGPPKEGAEDQIAFEREEGISIGWEYTNGSFVIPPPVDDDESITFEAVAAARQAGYQAKSDPVFFRWQRGTATEQDWLDAVAQVKQDNPYPS